MSTLYLTEKPSQVVALKKVIKDKNVLYEPLAGHIMRQYKPEEYEKTLFIKNWYKNVVEKKYPYFPQQFEKRVQERSVYKKNGKTMTYDYKKRLAEIKKSIDSCTEIIIASDPDNEGATLAYEVIEACNGVSKIKGMINMAKLDPISLAKSVKIWDQIPYKAMNDAGNARAQFDWLFGMNLSPIASVLLGQGQTLHMGGVKLPTLRMVVERDIAFESFKEIPFWQIAGLGKDSKTGTEFPITIKVDATDKFDQESVAQAALDSIPNNVNVTYYAETHKNTPPPKPYSLTDLQNEAGRMYKFSPKNTANYAQKLYDMGVQSYPRTEENYLAEGQYAEVDPIINNLSQIKEFSGLNINKPYKKRAIFNDKKLEGKAHTALSPTMSAVNLSSLGANETKIYLLVAKRYIIQFMEDYEYTNIKIGSKEKNYDISASENIKVSDGWKKLYSAGSNDDKLKRTFPVMKKGDTFNIVKIELKKGFTKPKPRFTESTLLKGMERIATIYDEPEVKKHLGENGIGTPATRAAIIEDLYNKGYIIKGTEGKDKNKVISTEKARFLIDILPEDITNPKLRAELEANTKDIVSGKNTFQQVKTKIEKTIQDFSDNIYKLSESKGLTPQKRGGGKPSQKQILYAESILSQLESNNIKYEPITSEMKEDIGLISAWIDTHKELAPTRIYVISEKQLKLIENPDNKATKAILDLVEKNKAGTLTADDYKKVQAWLKKLFSSFKSGGRKKK